MFLNSAHIQGKVGGANMTKCFYEVCPSEVVFIVIAIVSGRALQYILVLLIRGSKKFSILMSLVGLSWPLAFD